MRVTQKVSINEEHQAGYLQILSVSFQRVYQYMTRSQAVARIADRTAKNCRGHVT